MYRSRYLTLDGWRGAAALGVFLYHRLLNKLPVGALWMGVQLFFVISGYCIAAAADNALQRDMGFGVFMKRRLRRIAPPYFAACVVAIVWRLWSKTKHYFWPEVWLYIQNFFMMQWISLTHAQLAGGPVPKSAFDNPRLLVGVFWSLNYEEQFYLVAALLVMVALVWRARAMVWAVVALTAGVAALEFGKPGLVTGLFCDYWLQFACGVAVYVRLCKVEGRAARWFDLGLLAALAICVREAARRGELTLNPHTFHFHGQLTICVAFAILLIVLRPFDEAIARSLPGRVFSGLGKFSYSLYLIHIPVVGLLYWAEKRWEPRLGMPLVDTFMIAAVLLASWIFYRLFERPFLNRPLPAVEVPQPRPVSDPALPVAQPAAASPLLDAAANE